MATLPPDPRTFTTWEDAFHHPLPVVRKLEQQLQRNIADNREKLRALVGASYRDLLGTAERIVDMHDQTHLVESGLVDVGRLCNTQLLERKVRNFGRAGKSWDGRGREGCKVVAQMKILQNFLVAAGRVLKGGGDALLVAKILVLGRLLLKRVADSSGALGEDYTHAAAALPELRRKLAGLRKRLLAHNERVLGQLGGSRTGSTNALAAYALITSSTQRDVLRYFLQIRFVRLERLGGAPAEADVLQMLETYGQTVLEARALFPRALAEAMEHLSRTPLLQDVQERAVAELGLVVYGVWIAEDVRKFMPWVRHDLLTAADVASGLAAWMKQAQEFLLQAVEEVLGNITDAQGVVEVRRRLLSCYLALSGALRQESHSQVFHQLRTRLLQRLGTLAGEAASSISIDITQNDSTPKKPERLWSTTLADHDLSNGAISFRTSIVRQRHGRDDTVQRNANFLDDWVARIERFSQIIHDIRAAKWDDDDFELDLEGTDADESLQSILSKRDPDQLQERLRAATSTALRGVYASIERAGSANGIPALLLRLLRETDQRRRVVGDVLELSDKPSGNAALITTLHRTLATNAADPALQQYAASMEKALVPATALWDAGSPPLPVQPSTATFRLLVGLQRRMSAVGDDLWSPAAVRVMKGLLDERLSSLLDPYDEPTTPLNGAPAPEAQGDNDDAVPAGTEREHGSMGPDLRQHERLVQMLFDVLYLQRVLAPLPADAESGLAQLANRIGSRAEIDEQALERMRKAAGEYWKRTVLLFGLLAP